MRGDEPIAVAIVFGLDQILGDGHTHHIIDRIPTDRQPREARLECLFQRSGDRELGIEGCHVRPRHHDFSNHRVAEFNHRANVGSLIALNDLVVERHIGHGEEL